MNILIDNAGFVNKGAELMLFAVKAKMKEVFPDAKFVIREQIANVSLDRIKQEGFYVLKNLDSGKYKMIPDRFTHFLGLIRPSNIDLVLDAGGFQFSDQWEKAYSKESNKRIELYYKKFKSYGAKIIFLPQALGPFKKNLSRDRITIVYEFADMIFAREQVSYNYLTELFGENSKISKAPDFTNMYKPRVALSNLLPSNEYVGIVPNQKMVTHTEKGLSNMYFDFLLELCFRLIQDGQRLILLNHEGIGDYEIIEKLKNKLPDDVIVLSDLNSAEVKAVIGRLKLLVSSRFHGVVSGLSQGVPTFCTGWSHKYGELLKDYQVEKNYLDVNDVDEAYKKINNVLKDKKREYIQTREVINDLENRTDLMWGEVEKILGIDKLF